MDLRLGFFEDFKGADTVLLTGSANGIGVLIQRIREFAISSETWLAIHEFAWVAPENSAELFAVRSLTTLPETFGCRFVWLCSAAEVEDVVAKLSSLAHAAFGHQYFDLAGSDTQLIVSVAEYDGIWSQTAG